MHKCVPTAQIQEYRSPQREKWKSPFSDCPFPLPPFLCVNNSSFFLCLSSLGEEGVNYLICEFVLTLKIQMFRSLPPPQIWRRSPSSPLFLLLLPLEVTTLARDFSHLYSIIYIYVIHTHTHTHLGFLKNIYIFQIFLYCRTQLYLPPWNCFFLLSQVFSTSFHFSTHRSVKLFLMAIQYSVMTYVLWLTYFLLVDI